MKVCHYIASKGLGRGEAYIELVNALCSQIDIVLLVPKEALFLPRVDSRIEVIEYVSRDSRRNPFLLAELYWLLKKMQPDIVHTHFAKATEIFHGINKMLKLRHVATKHNPRKGKIFNRLENVIAVSEGVRKSVLSGKATVIYNGIAVEEIEAKEKNSTFKMIAVGRLDKIKGFDILINEVAKLDFDFELNIVGDGEERGRLESLVVSLQLGDKVKLLGFRKDIPELLSEADLQVMSSHSEGFSLAMIEAAFYSKVFVSTNVAGSNEILPEELLIDDFDISEKLSSVYNNYVNYCNIFDLVKKKYAGVLSIDACSRNYIEYYGKIYGIS
ncbi:glycosyltransferase [Malonomonas rubra]|uniref:glycosyltransferase n=1 Tax=Malonomonas rubra TaxID=57040 RepID=UPI0026EEF912|nr:glycosyltransferase [Malonomonas rubra]